MFFIDLFLQTVTPFQSSFGINGEPFQREKTNKNLSDSNMSSNDMSPEKRLKLNAQTTGSKI
jgi:hypothetical protein